MKSPLVLSADLALSSWLSAAKTSDAPIVKPKVIKPAKAKELEAEAASGKVYSYKTSVGKPQNMKIYFPPNHKIESPRSHRH